MTVVLPLWGTELLAALMDESDGEATGAAKVTVAVWITVTVSVVSLAV